MSLIDRSTVKLVLRLLEYSFRQGVLDACKYQDEFLCREFIRQRRENHDFGTLDIGEPLDWEEWRYILTKWSMRCHIHTVCEKYLDKIVSMNYNWVIFPVAMEFYILGIEEYLEYPNIRNLELFKNKPRVHWYCDGRPFKGINTESIVTMIQDICYTRKRKDAFAQGCPSAISYDAFCRTIWTCTRPIPRDV